MSSEHFGLGILVAIIAAVQLTGANLTGTFNSVANALQ